MNDNQGKRTHLFPQQMKFNDVFEVSKESEFSLKESVTKLYDEDVRSQLEIKKLLKTPNTFDNSLGELYEYLTDKKICITCPNSFFNCPKEYHGLTKSLYYDKERDEIRTKLDKCPKKREIETILDNIKICDCNKEDTYYNFTTIFEKLKNDSEGLLKDTKSFFFKNIFDEVKTLKNNTYHKGYCICTPNKPTYSNDILKAIAFMFAKVGYTVGFMDAYDLYQGISDFNKNCSQFSIRQFNTFVSLDVLCIKDIDSIKYKSEKVCEFYRSLLNCRNKRNLITFATRCGEYPLKSFIKYKFQGDIETNEIQEKVDNIFKEKNIREEDYR